MSVFLVPDALAGQRVDVVASRVTGHSRSRVAELIAAGGMLLDGETVKRASQIVTAGAMLELVTDPRPTRVALSLAQSSNGLPRRHPHCNASPPNQIGRAHV